MDREQERARPDICKKCWDGRMAFAARLNAGKVTESELKEKQKTRDWSGEVAPAKEKS